MLFEHSVVFLDLPILLLPPLIYSPILSPTHPQTFYLTEGHFLLKSL